MAPSPPKHQLFKSAQKVLPHPAMSIRFVGNAVNFKFSKVQVTLVPSVASPGRADNAFVIFFSPAG
jgi:hypothetical protein